LRCALEAARIGQGGQAVEGGGIEVLHEGSFGSFGADAFPATALM
jgi:hypothetical protein